MQVSFQIAAAPVNEIPYKESGYNTSRISCSPVNNSLPWWLMLHRKKRESKLMLSSRRKVK